jgi:hypothetical protein
MSRFCVDRFRIAGAPLDRELHAVARNRASIVFVVGVRPTLDGGERRQIQNDAPASLLTDTADVSALARLGIARYGDYGQIPLEH